MQSDPNFDDFKIYIDEYEGLGLIGMTRKQEQAFLHWFAKTAFAGKGEIVDLGSWMGSTVVPLARGLKENPLPETKKHNVHAFDRFTWVEWFDDTGTVNALGMQGKYKAGESFLDAFLEIVAPWKERIEVHEGDLLDIGWKEGPIEIIHIDAMKNWGVANAIVRNFFPHLLPGNSYILHQDFAHFHASWIHLLMFRLRDYFQPVYQIPDDDSVLFRYINKIPTGLLQSPLSFSDFSNQEINAAFDYSMSLVSADKKGCIAACKAMLHVHMNDRDAADEILREYASKGIRCETCCNQVRWAIETNRWVNLE